MAQVNHSVAKNATSPEFSVADLLTSPGQRTQQTTFWLQVKENPTNADYDIDLQVKIAGADDFVSLRTADQTDGKCMQIEVPLSGTCRLNVPNSSTATSVEFWVDA